MKRYTVQLEGDPCQEFIKYSDHLAEIERYKKALDWLACHDKSLSVMKWKNAEGYGVGDASKKVSKILGEGSTPLEAIEAAMKEHK